MKKVTVIVLAAALAIFTTDWPGQVEQIAYARDGVRGRVGDGRSGGRGGFVRGGGFDHGRRGGGHFNVWFGPVWGWDPFFYPYYPYYPYNTYYPYYYSQPPVVIQQQPQEYVMPESQQQEPAYWYYCKEAKGYYPYVKKCPGGWMKVVPTPAPDQEE